MHNICLSIPFYLTPDDDDDDDNVKGKVSILHLALPRHLLTLMFKHSPYHPILDHPHSFLQTFFLRFQIADRKTKILN